MEIKFRVWDRGEQDDFLRDEDFIPKMIYNAQSLYDGMGIEGRISANCFGQLLNDPKFDVMQFINKIDCNGKEIYRGDIVKCTHDEGLSWVKTKIDIGEVIYSDQCMFVLKCLNPQTRNAKDIKKRHFYISFKPDRKFKVIGNIYENPELIQS